MSRFRGLVFLLALTEASCTKEAPSAKPPPVETVDLRGKLLDENGAPVSRIAVMLDLGRQKFGAGTRHAFFRAASHRFVKTSEDGSFAFEKVPSDAKVHLICLGLSDDHGPAPIFSGACVLRGTAGALSRAAIELRLTAGSSVTGKITSHGSETRIYAASGDGWVFSSGSLDRATGEFTLPGVLPGDCSLTFQRGNYLLDSRPLLVPDGRAHDAGKFELLRPGVAEAPDPEIRAVRARLVDPSGNPIPGLRLNFSTPSADGQAASDDKGEVLMKGGGIEIGGPPFRLYLDELEADSGRRRFFGIVADGGDTATVTVAPLTKVRLTFRRSGTPVADLVVLAQGRTPGSWSEFQRNDATFEAWLPPGRAHLVVGTIQATTLEKDVDVPAAEEHSLVADLP